MVNVASINIDFEKIFGLIKSIFFNMLRIVPDFMRSLPFKVRLALMIIFFIFILSIIFWAYKNREAWLYVDYS